MSTIKVDTVRPVTTDADLVLQGDASGSGVTGAKVFGDGSLGADSITDLAGTGAPDFPNGLTLASNATGGNITGVTLDDYEEGTWSSTSLSSLVNVTFSPGATTFSGRYTKIGNKVTLSTDSTGVPIGTIAATNTFTKFTINGLPFSSASGQNAFGVVWDSYHDMAGVCFMSSGTSSIFIYFDNISVGFTGSVVPRFSITYEV